MHPALAPQIFPSYFCPASAIFLSGVGESSKQGEEGRSGDQDNTERYRDRDNECSRATTTAQKHQRVALLFWGKNSKERIPHQTTQKNTWILFYNFQCVLADSTYRDRVVCYSMIVGYWHSWMVGTNSEFTALNIKTNWIYGSNSSEHHGRQSYSASRHAIAASLENAHSLYPYPIIQELIHVQISILQIN